MESRKVAIEMLMSGISQRKVAMSMKCTHGAIQKLWKKFLATDSIQNIKKSRRPSKTTERERRLLTKLCKKYPLKSARELKCEWNPEKQISITTIKRLLRKYKLFGH